jgi:hypothetical protein
MAKQILPIFEIDELIEIFGYKNKRAIQHAMRQGNFPIRTFKVPPITGRVVVHQAVVERYFETMKEEGLEDLEDPLA